MSMFDPKSLGGNSKSFNGISVRQNINSVRTSDNIMARKIVSKSWNKTNAADQINGHGRAIGPYRSVNNLGDYLSRQAYTCGGSNQTQSKRGGSMLFSCDSTKVESSSTNCKWVSDSSDYTRHKRINLANRLYNDNSL
jgi:hypothetical protein